MTTYLKSTFLLEVEHLMISFYNNLECITQGDINLTKKYYSLKTNMCLLSFLLL